MSKIEKIENYYPNGMLREKGTKKDGKPVGKWIACYESGEKFHEPNFEDGKPQKTTQWYQNGIKEWVRIGYYSGKETQWYEKGNRYSEINFKGTKKFHGKATLWYENGQKRDELNYINGTCEGKRNSWYETGEKEYEDYYKDDNLNGKHISYFKNGQIFEAGFCPHGCPNNRFLYCFFITFPRSTYIESLVDVCT